ncbi:MAG: hypothetical protein V1703_04645, partial [Candidatus Altiarchaeota archaeon]
MKVRGEVRFKVDDRRADLEIILPEDQLKALGSFDGDDNVAALRRVTKKFPDLLPSRYRRKSMLYRVSSESSGVPRESIPEKVRYAGVSLANLLDLAGGRASKKVVNVGSSVNVVIKAAGNESEEVYRAVPSPPSIVGVIRKHARRAKSALTQQFHSLGVPEEELQAQLGRIDGEVALARKAARLSQLGFSGPKVSEAVGMKRHSVNDWMSGNFLPTWIATLNPERMAKLEKPMEIPREKSEPFAYLLGACKGMRRSKHYTPYFYFSSMDREVVKNLKGEIEKATGREVSMQSFRRRREGSKPGRYYHHRIKFMSNQLAEHLNGVTEGNVHMPLEHLGTKEEREAYALGLVDFSGGLTKQRQIIGGEVVYYPRMDLARGCSKDFAKELAVSLYGMGMLPIVELGDRPGVHLYEWSEVRKFDETVGFTSKSRQAMMTEFAQMERSKKAYDPKKYERVMRYVGKEANPERIARATGVAPSTVRHWLGRDAEEQSGVKPPSVKRREELEKYRQEVGDIDVPAYLYRLGVDAAVAMDFARSVDLKTVERLCARLEEKGFRGTRLAKAVERIHEAFSEGEPLGQAVRRLPGRKRRNGARVKPAEKPEPKVDPDALTRHVDGLRGQLDAATEDSAKRRLSSQISVAKDRLAAARDAAG